MMNLKFNIWDTKEKKMHIDVLCDIGSHDNFVDDVDCWSVCHDAKQQWPASNPRFIWLQYVGMEDVEEKGIYRGHVLEFQHGSTKPTIAEVIYDAPAFCLKILESDLYKTGVTIQWDTGFFKNPKILGNIHQPENIKR